MEKVINNKNQYEEIIDQMMIDEISALNGGGDEIREFIESGPTEDKRLSILSILDKDQRIYKSIRPLMKDDSMTPSKHISTVVTMLREYVKVGLVEKKKFGEVMTPQELVIEMLEKLPKHVWLNPDLKWLDPCNGVGIFPAVVVSMLMKGLEQWEPDEELRYKHIVENMLYVGELQPKNMFLFLCAFDPKDKYELNVYTGSFLDEGFDEHMKSVWGVEGFDIIVGNPPYNDGDKKGKNSSLWTKFVIKSGDLFLDNGFLSFVTPSSWLAPSDTQKVKLKQVFYGNDLQHLDLTCGKYFNSVGSTFTHYLIRKSNIYNGTIVNGVCVNLKYPFLPNVINCGLISIMDKVFFNSGDKLKFSSSKRNDDINMDDNRLYGVWYGDKLKYSNTLGKNHNIKKVVVSKPGYLKAKYDDGVYNTSANNYWVEVNNETEGYNLISFFNSGFSMKLLNKLFKYSGFNSLGVLKSLPLTLITKKWTDLELYENFNLTQEEINLIENL